MLTTHLDMLNWVMLILMCTYELCGSAVMPGKHSQLMSVHAMQATVAAVHACRFQQACQDLEALQFAAGYPCKHARASNFFPRPVQAEYLRVCTYSGQSNMRKAVACCAQRSRDLGGAPYLPVLIRVTFSRDYRMYDGLLRPLHGVQGFQRPCGCEDREVDAAAEPAGKLQQRYHSAHRTVDTRTDAQYHVFGSRGRSKSCRTSPANSARVRASARKQRSCCCLINFRKTRLQGRLMCAIIVQVHAHSCARQSPRSKTTFAVTHS